MPRPKRILVCPLNWGLGHATRCIPIIQRLLKKNAEVFIASDGRSLELLQQEFPNLPCFSLPSYGIRYRSANMTLNMASQLPRITWALFQEHRVIRRLVQTYQLDGILSDNRYGCHHQNCQTVFLTHQLNIRIPHPLLEKIVAWINRRAIHGFDRCWVPDLPPPNNLAGILSEAPPSHPVTYLGLLSRMKKTKPADLEWDVLLLLSGPEPQRTRLEKLLIAQAQQLPYRFLLVQGKPEEQSSQWIAPNIQQIAFLKTQELNQAILNSRYIVCRSGYSSMMDLAQLAKKALVIPTPGQTEQEYLASRLQERGWVSFQTQKELDLAAGLQSVQRIHGFPAASDETDLLDRALEEWLTSD